MSAGSWAGKGGACGLDPDLAQPSMTMVTTRLLLLVLLLMVVRPCVETRPRRRRHKGRGGEEEEEERAAAGATISILTLVSGSYGQLPCNGGGGGWTGIVIRSIELNQQPASIADVFDVGDHGPKLVFSPLFPHDALSPDMKSSRQTPYGPR